MVREIQIKPELNHISGGTLVKKIGEFKDEIPPGVSANSTSTSVDLGGEGRGDSTVAQTIQDVKDKAEGVRLNKDGTPRKRKGFDKDGRALPPKTSEPVSIGGFTEPQVKAAAKGLFSVAALSTDCSVWFLEDSEADCFVPSATLALNQTFPSVAQSKWGAISLASLSFLAVVTAKTLVYMQYKQRLAAERARAIETPVN